MPMLRERAKLGQRKEIITESPANTKWTLAEKKKLLIALRKFRPENLEDIRREFLPKRTEREISVFIERMKCRGGRNPIKRERVPIENWENMAENLTSHDIDYSFVLAEVFEKIANEEGHFPKNQPENPDWKLLYTYFAALLKGEEPPEVGQIEAAVLLDLTEALAQHLKVLDTTKQVEIMAKKYNLLASRINATSLEEAMELTERAFEDSELISATASTSAGTTVTATSQSSSQIEEQTTMPANQGVGPSTSTAPTNQGESSSMTPAVQGGSSSTVPASQGESSSMMSAYQKGRVSVTSTMSRYVKLLGKHRKRMTQARKRQIEIMGVVTELQKSTVLYSINPFFVPIRYLNPRIKDVPRTKPSAKSSSLLTPVRSSSTLTPPEPTESSVPAEPTESSVPAEPTESSVPAEPTESSVPAEQT